MDQLGSNIDTISSMDDVNTAFQFADEELTERMDQIGKHGSEKPRNPDAKEESAKRFNLPTIITETIDKKDNVFDAVADYFETIPLVNIEYQAHYLEIPFFFKHDRERYIAYLGSWIERNEATLRSRESVQIDAGQIEDVVDAAKSVKDAKNTAEVIDKMNTILNNAKKKLWDPPTVS